VFNAYGRGFGKADPAGKLRHQHAHTYGLFVNGVRMADFALDGRLKRDRAGVLHQNAADPAVEKGGE
jgi:hypothetical protein